MRRKNFGETTTGEGHTVFFSGEEDKQEHGVGFLVHKDMVNTVMGCRPVSSRLITIRLRAVPFNITVIQVYPPSPTNKCTPTAEILGLCNKRRELRKKRFEPEGAECHEPV